MKKLLLLSLLIAAPASAQQVVKLPAQDKPLTGKPAVQFSIGAEDGEDWELLSRVTQVAFDREENLYVLDGGNNRVLVFNPQGLEEFGATDPSRAPLKRFAYWPLRAAVRRAGRSADR